MRTGCSHSAARMRKPGTQGFGRRRKTPTCGTSLSAGSRSGCRRARMCSTGMASRSDRFRKAYGNALKQIGITSTPHDMRRSAIRNFTRAGVSESEGMSVSGHKTNSTYKRYNVIDEELQRLALGRVARHQREPRRVVPLNPAISRG